MAEAEVIIDVPEEMESEPTGITLLDFLDAGNLIEAVPNVMDVGQDLRERLQEAEQSMEKWKKKYDRAVKLAAMIPEAEEKTWPFEDASNVMLPFILEIMLDFHARTVPELVYNKDVIGMKTYGKPSPQKDARADRVSTFMNWQIIEEIGTWRSEQDRMLLQLPCIGTAYKKTYYNSDEQAACSDLYRGDEVIFDMNYPTFDEAPCKFIYEEYTRNELLEYVRGDMAWQMDELTIPTLKEHPERFEFIRAYMWIDMDDDGLTEPYEVIYDCENERVVAVYPAYDEDDVIDNENGEIVKVTMAEIFTQYIFLPDPEGSPMGMGWGILLGDLFDAINSNMNQLIDAGTLANIAGSSGFYDQALGQGTMGTRVMSGPIDVRMGEMNPLQASGNRSLRDSIYQFPYQGPNTTLFTLLEWMVTQARNMTNAAVNMDTNSQEAAIMYLARLQQGLKIPNSIVMRVYSSAKQEFKKLALINYKHHDSDKYNRVLDEEQEWIMMDDFNPDDCDVEPSADPSQGTDIERMNRASIIWTEAKEDASGIFAKRQAARTFVETLNVPDPMEIVPDPDPNPDIMQQIAAAQMAWDAQLQGRELKLRELKLQLEHHQVALKAVKEMTEMGLQADKTEAEIAKLYAETMHKLWEMGVLNDQDPARVVQELEQTLIDKQAPNIPMPQPVSLPELQPPGNPMQQQQGQQPQQ